MTTTELIKILQDNETGAISLKPREISLIINGRYMPNPQITLSSTGDGICGPEIDLDINGKWLEQEPCEDCISRAQALSDYADWYGYGYRDNAFYKHLKDMPPVTPQQEPCDVLDKIRAEIEKKCCITVRSENEPAITLYDVFQILDKYKAESEE